MEISISPRADAIARRWRVALWALVAVAAIAAVVGAVLVSRSSMFHARAIRVEGESHLSRADVVEAAGVSLGTNVPWLDEGVAERRLAAVPWIADATVRASLPWSIEITVVERTPVAIADDGTREVLVAADGTVLGSAGATRGMPEIRLAPPSDLPGAGQSPRGAATAIGAMAPDLRADVATVTVLADGSLEMRMRGGVVVRYGGAEDVRRKAVLLGRILGWARREEEILSAVSVVAPGHPAVRFLD